jgi:hypothetical protein
MGELTLPLPALSGCLRQFVHAAAWKLAISREEGFCVVATASACVDFCFDFVALRGCIGADGAFTVAAIASCPSQRRSRGCTSAPRGRDAITFAIRRWRETAGDRPGSGAGAGSSGHEASGRPGRHAEAYADARKTGAGKTSAGKTNDASRGANGTQPAVGLRDRRSQCGRRNACGAAAGEPDDDLWGGP